MNLYQQAKSCFLNPVPQEKTNNPIPKQKMIKIENYKQKLDEIKNLKRTTLIIKGLVETRKKIEEMKIGTGTVNYRLRDAIFSRQRYWGEPFPIYYKDGMPYALDESKLPLELPKVDSYLPTSEGNPPLANAKDWVTEDGYPLETNTMPGFAGSSGYYLRFMNPNNKNEYFSKEANQYWQDESIE